MEGGTGFGPERRGRKQGRKKQTPYDRPSVSEKPASASQSGGAAENQSSILRASFVRRSIAWAAAPLVNLAQKLPGVGSQSLSDDEEVVEPEDIEAEPSRSSPHPEPSDQMSRGAAIGAQEADGAADGRTTLAAAAGVPFADTLEEAQQAAPGGEDSQPLTPTANPMGGDSELGTVNVLLNLVSDSPSISRVQTAERSRPRRTSLAHGAGTATPGLFLPAFNLPDSPVLQQEQASHMQRGEPDFPEPSISQPVQPPARPRSGEKGQLFSSARPRFNTGLERGVSPWSVGKPAQQTSGLSGKQFANERRQLFQTGFQPKVPSGKLRIGDAGPSRFGQTGATPPVNSKRAGELSGVKPEAVQFGHLPQGGTEFGGQHPFYGPAHGGGANAYHARRLVAPSRSGSGRTPVAAQPLSFGMPGPAMQAITHRPSSSEREENQPQQYDKLAGDRVAQDSPEGQLHWTPMRTYPSLQSRSALSGIKRERDPSPARTPGLERSIRQKSVMGSAERRHWRAGETPFHPAKTSAGAGGRHNLMDYQESPTAVDEPTIGGSRPRTATAERIFKALEATAAPSPPTARSLAALMPPPPSDSMADVSLGLPPPVTLPLAAASARFSFLQDAAPAQRRGFLANSDDAAAPQAGAAIAHKPKVGKSGSPPKSSLPGGSAGIKAPAEKPKWPLVQVPETSIQGPLSFSGGFGGSFAAAAPSTPSTPASHTAGTERPAPPEQGSAAKQQKPAVFTLPANNFDSQAAAIASQTVAGKGSSKIAEKQLENGKHSFTFGGHRTAEQELLASIVQAAKPSLVPPPIFSFGTKKDAQKQTGSPFASPTPKAPPSFSMAVKHEAPGCLAFSFGATRKSESAEKKQSIAEAVKAATVQLPPDSDTEEDAADQDTTKQQGAKENGVVQHPAAEKPAGKQAPDPAPSAGGWDFTFLQKNKAMNEKTTAAMAEEIEKAKKGDSPSPSSQTFSFGVPQIDKAEKSSEQKFTFGVPQSIHTVAKAPQQAEQQPSGLLDFLGKVAPAPQASVEDSTNLQADGKDTGKAMSMPKDGSSKTPTLFGLPAQPGTTALGAQQAEQAASGPAKGNAEQTSDVAAPQLAFGAPPGPTTAEPAKEPPPPINAKREPSNGSERAMSISPSIATAAKGTDFNEASSAEAQFAATAPPVWGGGWGIRTTATSPSGASVSGVPKFSSSTGIFSATQQSTPAFGGASAGSMPSTGFVATAKPAGFAFGSQQTAANPSGGFAFASQPGVVPASSAPSSFGGAAPTANGFTFGASAASTPAATAPGFGSAGFGSTGPFGAAAPSFGAVQFGSSAPAFGSSTPSFGGPAPATASGQGLFAFGNSAAAASQAQSMPAMGAFGPANGAPANGPFGGSAPFGAQQAPTPVFGSQGQFVFNNATGQMPSAGMTLGTASDNAQALARRKVKAKRTQQGKR